MEKLTIEHLAPYLPYGLKFGSISKSNIILQHGTISIDTNRLFGHVSMIDGDKYKPILHPLSDLTKEIEVNGERFVPRGMLGNLLASKLLLIEWESCLHRFDLNKNFDRLPYIFTQKLFEWHFDVFGFIEKSLAIDINTLQLWKQKN
jgi:hypothetical protein